MGNRQKGSLGVLGFSEHRAPGEASLVKIHHPYSQGKQNICYISLSLQLQFTIKNKKEEEGGGGKEKSALKRKGEKKGTCKEEVAGKSFCNPYTGVSL